MEVSSRVQLKSFLHERWQGMTKTLTLHTKLLWDSSSKLIQFIEPFANFSFFRTWFLSLAYLQWTQRWNDGWKLLEFRKWYQMNKTLIAMETNRIKISNFVQGHSVFYYLVVGTLSETMRPQTEQIWTAIALVHWNVFSLKSVVLIIVSRD